MWANLSAGGAIFYNHKPRMIGTRLWTPLQLVPPEVELRQIITWARPGGMNYSPAAFVPTSESVTITAKPAFRLKSKGVSGFGDVWSMRPDRNSHPGPSRWRFLQKSWRQQIPASCSIRSWGPAPRRLPPSGRAGSSSASKLSRATSIWPALVSKLSI